MRPNLVAVGVVLLLGVLVLRTLASSRGDASLRSWIPWTALIAGPLVPTAGLALQVFVFSADQYIKSDFYDMLPGVLFIGTFAGCLAALVLGTVSFLQSLKGQ